MSWREDAAIIGVGIGIGAGIGIEAYLLETRRGFGKRRGRVVVERAGDRNQIAVGRGHVAHQLAERAAPRLQPRQLETSRLLHGPRELPLAGQLGLQLLDFAQQLVHWNQRIAARPFYLSASSPSSDLDFKEKGWEKANDR